MKNLSFIILIICTVSASCQGQRDIKLYYLKIAPIGISDFPRDTLYFSIKKLDGIINIDSTKYVGLINQIITDETTLSRMVSFVNENDYNKNFTNKDFKEYGCFNISLYDKNSLITSYNLGRLDSKEYLNSLIDMLVKNNLDMKVIKELKERCLTPIDY